jgi:hypothetical protein
MIDCDQCGSKMSEDILLSTIEYDNLTKVILNEEGEIIYENLPDYLVFSCKMCGETKNIKISDIIKNLQNKIVSLLLKERLKVIYTTADRSKVDEASGVSYCGLCPGVIDESGYCYNDVISQCRVRKVKLG